MGEEALVDFSSGEWFVGSTDATTCLIAVVVCQTTRKAWAAHYNSRLAAQDTSILRLLPRWMRTPELYLIGSFREPTGESAATLGALLRHLHAAPLRLLVRLACVDAANTDAAGAPRALHLAVHCSPVGVGAGSSSDAGAAGAGCSGSGDGGGCAARASPSGFADRGPELPRRFAHDYLSDRTSTSSSLESDDAGGSDSGSDDGDNSDVGDGQGDNHAGDRGESEASAGRGPEASSSGDARKRQPRDDRWNSALRSIVDTTTGRLRVPGLHCRQPQPYMIAHYVRQLQLPDDVFLRRNSTSPDFEPPNFVGDIRAAYRYILEQYTARVTRIPDVLFEWEGEVLGSPGGAVASASGGSGWRSL